MTEAVYVENTNNQILNELKTDAFVNDAVVLVTIKDTHGTEVGGQGWPITMDYIAGVLG